MVATRLFLALALLGNAVVVAISGGTVSGQCESLKLKPPLTYTQDKAPRDLSGVVSLFFCMLNLSHGNDATEVSMLVSSMVVLTQHFTPLQ